MSYKKNTIEAMNRLKNDTEPEVTLTEERYSSNLLILNLLREFIKKYKEMRFEQALFNVFPLTEDGRVPDLDFNRESKVTLERLKKERFW